MNSGSDQASSFPPWLQSAGKETPVQPQEQVESTSHWRQDGAARTGPTAKSVNLPDSTGTDSWSAQQSERKPDSEETVSPHTEELLAPVKGSESDSTQTGVSKSQFVKVPVKSSVLRAGFQPTTPPDSTQQSQQVERSVTQNPYDSDGGTASRRSNFEEKQPPPVSVKQGDSATTPHMASSNVEQTPHSAGTVSFPPRMTPPKESSAEVGSPQLQSLGQALPSAVQSTTPSKQSPDVEPVIQAPQTQLVPPAVYSAQQAPQAGKTKQSAPATSTQMSPAALLPEGAPQAVQLNSAVAQAAPAQSLPHMAQGSQTGQTPQPKSVSSTPQLANHAPQENAPSVSSAVGLVSTEQTGTSVAATPPAAEPPLAQAAPRPQPTVEPADNHTDTNIGVTSLDAPLNVFTDGMHNQASGTVGDGLAVPLQDTVQAGSPLQGNPFNPSDDPNQYLAPPAGLDQSILIDPVKRAPKSGWRKIIHSITAGYINLGDSEKVDRHQKLIEQTRAPLRGDYKVAVLSLKGGVGKTTTSVMLGGIFASLRGDRVIAIDANPDFGNLAQRAAVPRSPTIRDLLNASDIEKYSDVRTYTTQAESNLEVIGSDRDPEISEAFSEDDYRHAIDILQHYYNIILTDCGTGLMHSAMKGVLDLANTLILVTSPALDGAQSASATLDWLSHQGYGQFVANAIVVVSSLPTGSPSVDVKQLVEHFQSRTRAVQVIPYDKHLSEGAVIDLERLDRKTYMAYLELASLVAQDFASWHRHAR